MTKSPSSPRQSEKENPRARNKKTSCACLCAQSPSPAMRPTTQPHLSALSFSAVPCEIDYSEPYSTPWAISLESVLPVGPSVCLFFSLIQYAFVKIGVRGTRTQGLAVCREACLRIDSTFRDGVIERYGHCGAAMVLWGLCGSLRVRGIGNRGRRTILPSHGYVAGDARGAVRSVRRGDVGCCDA